MGHLGQDVRIALRGFRRSLVFAATAVLILAVGIGMSVAMFEVFRAVLIQRLPVVDQDRIVVLSTFREGGVEAGATMKPAIAEFRRRTRELSSVAGVVHWGAVQHPLTAGERSIVMNEAMVDGNFFDVLGARPALGRLLRGSDEQGGWGEPAGHRAFEHAIVISYDSWQKQFGGDSSVIGRRLSEPYTQLAYTVVGVAPAGLDFPQGVGYWLPVGADVDGLSMIAVGRLKPGASPAAARSEYLLVTQRLAPQAHIAGALVKTLSEAMLGDVRPTLLVLMLAVGLLLLIACVNVGNLLLLRAATRSREVAIRRAVGASYGDIARQLLVESVVLAIMGGALGLACASAILHVLVALAPAQLPRIDVVRLFGTPVSIAIAITTVAVLLFGVVPALTTARVDPGSPLRLDWRTGADSKARRRVRELLVGSQIALALVMVAGAGLLAQSLARLQRLDLGYRVDHLSLFAITIPFLAQRYDAMPKVYGMGAELFPRLRAIPGVTAVTPVIVPPLVGPSVYAWRFTVEGQSPSDVARNPSIAIEGGGPEYFRTMGIPIVRGRGLSGPEGAGAPEDVVVSEAAARLLFSGQDPIGKRIRTTWPDSNWHTVVGVAGDTHYRSFREATPEVIMQWRQSFWIGEVAIRTNANISRVLPAIRRVVHDVDPQLAVWDARSMDDFLAAPLAEPRLSTLLLSSFGIVALFLAAIGLYGVMAFAVRQQTREMGVRMALGATPERLRRAVMRSALGVTGAGATAGLALAFMSSRLIAGLLFEVSPADPIVLVGASALLLVVGQAAAYLPARRATNIDPASVLRLE